MTWWIRIRLVPWIIAGTLALAIAGALGQHILLQVPSLFGLQSLVVPVGFFAPALVVAAAGAVLARAPHSLEMRSRRPTRIWDLCLLGVLIGCTLAPYALTGSTEGLRIARSLGIGLGMMLCSTAILPTELVSLPPIAYLLVGILTGRAYARPAWWNWPVMETTDAAGTVWFVVMIVTGSIIHATGAQIRAVTNTFRTSRTP